ncbi:hypothetical protein ACLBW7_17670 [Klebsiella grimontii]
MKKLEHENFVFECAKKTLEDIYGAFSRDLRQTDRPDAAIVLENIQPQKSIGIEITSCDSFEHKLYFNDRKFSKKIESQQVDDCLNGIPPTRPLKKESILIPRNYIYKAIHDKSSKYKGYKEANKYNEVILLVTSEFLEGDYAHFQTYIAPWTNYLLSNLKYPFDKVIFVCLNTRKNYLIYDKKKPTAKHPKIDPDKELGTTQTHTGMLTFGVEHNLNALMKAEPLIKPRISAPRKNK